MTFPSIIHFTFSPFSHHGGTLAKKKQVLLVRKSNLQLSPHQFILTTFLALGAVIRDALLFIAGVFDQLIHLSHNAKSSIISSMESVSSPLRSPASAPAQNFACYPYIDPRNVPIPLVNHSLTPK